MKTAVILCNLGGPDSLDAVQPFLFNLFSDKAIISLPNPFRFLLAKFISKKRAPIAKEIYEHIGGKSPLLSLTSNQATALEDILNSRGEGEYKSFVMMRYWHPFSKEVLEKVKTYAPDHVIILPLYPQFSKTTTGSSFHDWKHVSKALNVPTTYICCYPTLPTFITAHVEQIQKTYDGIQDKENLRILFSAHGLPEKVIKSGDPYQRQVEQTAEKVVEALSIPSLDWVVCYQSKVGRLEWIKPSTEDEIMRAGKEGKSVLIVPIAFVSDHSETLVELDIEYKELADEAQVPSYTRVPALNNTPHFIESLAQICVRANKERDNKSTVFSGEQGYSCGQEYNACPCRKS